MNDDFSAYSSASDKVLEAIGALKSRGARYRRRGIRFLGAAGVVAAVAAAAFVMYLNVQPDLAFTSVDLPTVQKLADKSADPSGGNLAAHAEPLVDLLNSPLVKGIIIVSLVLAGAFSVMTGNFGFISFAAPAAVGIFVVSTLAPALLGTSPNRPDNDAYLLQKLLEEARYVEVATKLEHEATPQAAYVRAQIAYLTNNADGLKADLDKMSASLSAEWVPDWERVNVMEQTAYGEARTADTQAYLAEAHDSMETRRFVLTSAGIAALINGLGGLALYALGTVLTRRARRLAAMLGITNGDSGGSASAGAVPNGQIQAPMQIPAAEMRVLTAQPATSLTDTLVVGVAAGMMASSLLDAEERPPRSESSSHANASWVSDSSTLSSSASSCDSGGDCGGGD